MAHFRYHTKMDERYMYTCMNQPTENTILQISRTLVREGGERREEREG